MTVRFTVGETYAVRSLGDWDCIFDFTVTGRTAKTVTLSDGHTEVRRGITVRDGVETVMPYGRYSMAPTLKADRTLAMVTS